MGRAYLKDPAFQDSYFRFEVPKLSVPNSEPVSLRTMDSSCNIGKVGFRVRRIHVLVMFWDLRDCCFHRKLREVFFPLRFV